MSRRVPAFLAFLAALALFVGAGIAAAPAARAGGGCHADMTGAVHTDGTASVVRMDVCSFEPTVARVPVGAEVTFLNTSTIGHVVLGRGQSWGGGDTLEPGASRVARFGEAGVFPYSCPLHPGMVGTIVVGDANTPRAAMGAVVGGSADGATAGDAAAPAQAPDAQAASEPATAAGGAVDVPTALGLGAAAGIAVLALGALVVRGRPGTVSPAG